MAKRNVEADISPGLREHITQAAQKIREDHDAELSDVLKADRAGRLFRSMIRPDGKPLGSFQETSGVSRQRVGLLEEFGALLSDSVRTGTTLLAIPLTVLAQEWMATVVGPTARPDLGISSAERPAPEERSQPQRSATPQVSGTTVDSAVSTDASEMPAASAEEVMLRGVFRQFMPMLVTSLSQGGDGYGLAETVIRLFGRPTYEQASGLGRDRIMQIVKAEPDLWRQVAPIEAKFSRFLDEFTNYDAWTEEQARARLKSVQNPAPGQ